MIAGARQWRTAGWRRPFSALPATASRPSPRPCLARRPASTLSAIHRGLRLAQRSGRRTEHRTDRTERALAGITSDRQRRKLRKKLDRKAADEEDDEGNGRQTRRKRFLDPGSSFGKKSLVYQLKHGVLKDDLASMIGRPELRPDGPDARASLNSTGANRGSGNGEPGLSKPIVTGKRASARGFEDLIRKSRVSMRKSVTDQSPWTCSIGYRGGDHEARLSKPAMPGRKNVTKDSARDLDNSHSTRASSIDDCSGIDDRELGEPVLDEPFEKQRQHAGLSTSRPRRPQGLNMSLPQQQPRHRERWIDPRLSEKRGLMKPNKTVPITSAASQYLYGRRVVKAALQMGRRAVFNLYHSVSETETETSKDVGTITRLAQLRRARVVAVPREDRSMLDKLSGGQPHNGFVLEASPLPQPPAASLGRLQQTPGKLGFHIAVGFQTWEEERINGSSTFIARSTQPCPKPLVLVAHEITDPVNLGGLMRTARYFGVDAVGILERSTASLMSVAALKTSAGAAEEVNLLRICNMVEFLRVSKKAGWKTFAAVKPPEAKLSRLHPERFVSSEAVERMAPLNDNPCVIVFGNEGQGLPQAVKVAADYELFIPGFGGDSTGVDSLNVAVAAGMLCHSFIRGSVNRPRPEVEGSRGSSSSSSEVESSSSSEVEGGGSSEVEGGGGSEMQGEMMF